MPAALTEPTTTYTTTTLDESYRVHHILSPEGGSARLILDDDEFSFFIELSSDFPARALSEAFEVAEGLGYEILEPDEAEAQVDPDGTMRIYLVPQDLEGYSL